MLKKEQGKGHPKENSTVYLLQRFYSESSILSLSCSSDLCNYVDGADLAAISSASGTCKFSST